MGFLDKVKAQAEQAVKQGQDKLEDVQAKKKADGMLRDLGAWYYATQTHRDDDRGEQEMARLVSLLNAHEAEHGPLGGDKDEPEPPAPPAPAAPPAPPATAEAAAPSQPPAPSAPPAPGAVPPPPPGAVPPPPPSSPF